jgi:hypothetical protein
LTDYTTGGILKDEGIAAMKGEENRGREAQRIIVEGHS